MWMAVTCEYIMELTTTQTHALRRKIVWASGRSEHPSQQIRLCGGCRVRAETLEYENTEYSFGAIYAMRSRWCGKLRANRWQRTLLSGMCEETR